VSGTRSSWWQRFGNAAQIASALVAMLGFGAVFLQISEIRGNARAASARQAYLGFTELELRHPEFAVPDYGRIREAPDALNRYESFVSYLLYACEEALAAFARQPEWRRTCDYNVRPHLPFLCEKGVADPAFLSTFGEETQDFVRAALARAGVTAPACALKGA
jgi:hypothetical protein